MVPEMFTGGEAILVEATGRGRAMTFENEPTLKSQIAPDENASSKMYQESLDLIGKQSVAAQDNSKAEYIHSMSTKCADALDNSYSGQPGPAKMLAEALAPLEGPDRNKLLAETKDKNDDFAAHCTDKSRLANMEHLNLENWNAKTGTWDKVEIVDGDAPLSSPFRIVQPGNSLVSFAGERLTQAYDYTHHMGEADQSGHPMPWSWKYSPGGLASTVIQIANMNKLGDANKEEINLKVGDVVRLPRIGVSLEDY